MKSLKHKIPMFVMMFVLASSTTAFAGSHHTTNKKSYSVCNISDCNLNYNHTHNGKFYSAHYSNDGHTYHTNTNHH